MKTALETTNADERGLVLRCPQCGQRNRVSYERVGQTAEGAGQWLVAKVNTEELPQLAQRFGISAIPTLVLMKAGHELARQAGAMPAQTILEFISATRPV